jgi:mono/diheme cytochrome c family protein
MLRLTRRFAVVLVLIILLWAVKASAQSGAEDYQQYCAGCHGPDGTGKETTWNHGKLPDLTRLSQANGGRFPSKEVHEVVDGSNRDRWHQHKGMPYWGIYFGPVAGEENPPSKAKAESRITAIVDYVRSLQKK